MWTAFLILLATALLLSTQHLATWRDERSLYNHNVRVDASDWRAYAFQFESNLRIDADCAVAPLEHAYCRLPWELSLLFAPTQSLKAQLHRYKIVFVLDDRRHACELYAALLRAHPTSAHALNNAGVCVFIAERLDESLARFEQAVEALASSGVEVEGRGDKSDGHDDRQDDDGDYTSTVPQTNALMLQQWRAAYRLQHGSDREPSASDRAEVAMTIMY